MAFSERLRSISVIDAAAAVVALVAVGGVLWSPKLSNTVARATGAIKPVEVTVDVRNTSAADPDQFIAEALQSGRTSLVIRNQLIRIRSTGVTDVHSDFNRFDGSCGPSDRVAELRTPQHTSDSHKSNNRRCCVNHGD